MSVIHANKNNFQEVVIHSEKPVLDWRIYVRIGIFVDLNVYNDYEKFFVSLLVSELSKRGHEISLYVPENMECGFSGAKNTVHLVGKSESSKEIT